MGDFLFRLAQRALGDDRMVRPVILPGARFEQTEPAVVRNDPAPRASRVPSHTPEHVQPAESGGDREPAAKAVPTTRSEEPRPPARAASRHEAHEVPTPGQSSATEAVASRRTPRKDVRQEPEPAVVSGPATAVPSRDSVLVESRPSTPAARNTQVDPVEPGVPVGPSSRPGLFGTSPASGPGVSATAPARRGPAVSRPAERQPEVSANRGSEVSSQSAQIESQLLLVPQAQVAPDRKDGLAVRDVPPARPGWSHAPSRRSGAAGNESRPVVKVTIGRVEVRAVAPPAPPPRTRRPGPKLTLEHYLEQRAKGER
jgi:hypothetical protein